jgi:hypothetical protein
VLGDTIRVQLSDTSLTDNWRDKVSD